MEDFIVRLLADVLVVPIVVIGAWAVLTLPPKVRWQRIARGVVAGLLAFVLARIAGWLYPQGERPFQALGLDPGASYLPNGGFPSDHVLFVFTITFVVWACTKNAKLSLVLLALSCLVAVGRVLALVHAPIDVVGGIACAAVAVLAVYRRSLFIKSKPEVPDAPPTS